MSEIMDIKQFAYSVGYQPGAYVDGAEAAQLRKMYAAYQQEAAKAMAKPQQPLTTTNLPTGHSVAMMGNTMQVLPQRFSEPYVGTDGKYYADDLNTGAQVLMTNSTGAPAVPPKPKQAVREAPYGMMYDESGQLVPVKPTQPAQQASGGVLSWLFGGGNAASATNSQTNTPTLPADIAAQVQPSAAPSPTPAPVAEAARPAVVLPEGKIVTQGGKRYRIVNGQAVEVK